MSLPVKRMVLYKHGVGFIERGDSFAGNDPIKLSFKRDTMDDILKSLCIFDMGKGRVTGLSYETGEDIAVQLAEKAITVPEQQALIGLMRQLKGYAVKLETVEGDLEGTVVGTQEGKTVTIMPGPSTPQQTVPSQPMATVKDYVLLKDKTGGMRAIDIERIVKFHILDEEAKSDLDFYLDAITSLRKKNTKAVTIFLEGGNHELKVSYIMSMPSWRVSYRLAFDKKETILQGWGIIDNKLDEDLKDIRLSLVAGKPISFIYDIYTPRIVPRPIVREEVRTVSAPVELESGAEALMDADMQPERERAGEDMKLSECMEERPMVLQKAKMDDSRAYGHGARARGVGSTTPSSGEVFAASPAVQTKTVEMGEFFKYDIDTPVTVKRGQSAMVPILQSKITCIKEHVYNNEKMPKNPVVTMKIKNDTGAVLERGPILVLDENTYVGEAILPYTSMESENHLAYSVDLGVIVNEKYNSGSELRTIRIANRYLQKEHLEWKECEYDVQNKKKDGIDFVLEHRKTDYKIDEKVTQKPTDTTESYYRWKFKIEGKTASKFKVREVTTRLYSEAIRTMGLETLKYYLNNNFINKRDFADVKAVIDLQIEINRINKEIADLNTERSRINEEQGRLRSNMNALGRSTQEEKLRAKYIEKLDGQEKRFEDIEAQIKKDQEKIKEIEVQIEELLKKMG